MEQLILEIIYFIQANGVTTKKMVKDIIIENIIVKEKKNIKLFMRVNMLMI
jgi:hypothetical protein